MKAFTSWWEQAVFAVCQRRGQFRSWGELEGTNYPFEQIHLFVWFFFHFFRSLIWLTTVVYLAVFSFLFLLFSSLFFICQPILQLPPCPFNLYQLLGKIRQWQDQGRNESLVDAWSMSRKNSQQVVYRLLHRCQVLGAICCSIKLL